MDICFGELKGDISVADERPVRRTTETVCQIFRTVVGVFLEYIHTVVVTYVIIPIVITLIQERPSEFLAFLDFSTVVTCILESVVRIVRDETYLFETGIPVFISLTDSCLIAVVNVVFVEYVLPDLGYAFLDYAFFRIGPGLGFEAIPEEIDLTLGWGKFVPILQTRHVLPFEFRAVSILKIIHEI